MVKRKRPEHGGPAVVDKAELFTAKLAESLHDQALAPPQVRPASLGGAFHFVSDAHMLLSSGGRSRRRLGRSFAPTASRQCHTTALAG